MSYYQNSYSAGDTFIDYSGNKYTVVTGGNTPSTPFDSSNIVNNKIVWGSLEFEPVAEDGGQGLVDWQANTTYNVGDIVVYDDKIYKCTTAHTSTSTFDDSKWTEISPGIASSVYATTTTLWSGAFNTVTAGTPFTLSDDYDNYDEILLMQEGQVLRSLVPSMSSGFGYDGDGGELGTNYSVHVIINFSGTTATPVIWQYGSGLASTTVYIVGRNYIKCEGYYATKDTLWTGNENTATPTGTTLSLTNNYTDYDYLLIYYGYNDSQNTVTIKNISLFDCSSPYSNFEYVFNTRVNSSTVSTVYADIDFSGSTWRINKYLTTISDVYVKKIVGIKFLPNPNNYSTIEQEIGTWIDGKKLYQKTITGTTPNTVGSEVVFATISSMETMVSIDGFIRDAYSNFIPVYYDNNGTANDYIYIFTNSTGDIYFKAGSSNYANKNFVITVKYTKV